MHVRFQSFDEFLTELELEAADTLQYIRLTQTYTRLRVAPLERVYLVATARIDDFIIRMDFFCGDIPVSFFAETDASRSVLARGDSVRKLIVEKCEKLGLAVRAGIWETGEGSSEGVP